MSRRTSSAPASTAILHDVPLGFAHTVPSEVLPAIDLALLARFADRVDQPKALREYRDALRAATT
jgi:hypothetical protein